MNFGSFFHKAKVRKTYREISCVVFGILLFVLLFTGGIKDASAKTPGRVLFISSYHPDFPTFFQQVDGIKSILSTQPIVLDIEFMDSKRFYDNTNMANFHASISYKLIKVPAYDLILTADDNALIFAIKHQEELFAGTPIIFFGVNNIDLAQKQNANPKVTGIVESVSMLDTLQLIRRLHPDTKNIIALVDSSPSGQVDLETFYSFSDELDNINLSEISLKDLSFVEFAARLQKMPDQTSFILLSAYKDKEGKNLLFNESLQLIRNNLPGPVYHLWYHGMGDGVFGGKLINHFDQSTTAAKIALEVLNGRPVEDIAVMLKSSNHYIFDYLEMKRFGIDRADLPEESTIINEPFSFYKKYKTIIWVVSSAFVSLLVLILFLVFNIIIRRRVEKSLRESEERIRTTMDQAGDGMFLIDSAGRLLDVNQRACEMLGYTKEELLSMSAPDIDPEYPIERFIKLISTLKLNEQTTIETVHRRKDGSIFSVEIRIGLIQTQGKEHVLALVRNITNRMQVEQERIQLVSAIEHIAEMIIITDRDGFIRYANPSFVHLTGFSQNETLGKTLHFFEYEAHEESFYLQMRTTIASGKTWTDRMVCRKKDGSPFDAEITISSIVDPEGDFSNYVSVLRDVTREIKVEEQLRQSQKMESIGTLAGGIAHDFNNILGAVMGYTEMSLDDVIDRPNTHESLNQVLAASHRAKDLVSQILTFSRSATINKVHTKTIPIVKEVCKFIRSSLPTTIEINQNITAKNDCIVADPTQFHQILMNLCTNAGHAMKRTGGELEVLLEEVLLHEDDVMIYPELKTGTYLKLTVKDTGYGISKENLERIFEPYFTTKEKGEGTGLGLAVVHGIVKEYGGDIKAYSEVGKGTVFHALFPLIKNTEETGHTESAETLPTGTETIMFIDDEKSLVNIGTKTLERLGYKVKGLTRPEEALILFKNSNESFDLIITDKTMPKVTGFDLAEEIKKIQPDMPIIICTGFADRDDVETIQNLGINAFIMKPINKREIAGTIREVLDQKLSKN